jgi:hypothetical protein
MRPEAISANTELWYRKFLSLLDDQMVKEDKIIREQLEKEVKRLLPLFLLLDLNSLSERFKKSEVRPPVVLLRSEVQRLNGPINEHPSMLKRLPLLSGRYRCSGAGP